MNIRKKERRNFYFLFFLVLFSSSLYFGGCSESSKSEKRYLDFSDFPFVNNIDSLERVLNSEDTLSKKYLHALVHFEINNSIQNSLSDRENTNRILDLVNSNSLFSEYEIIAKYLDAYNLRKTNMYESFKQALPVLGAFKAQNDSIGIFRLLFVLSSLNLESEVRYSYGSDDSYIDYKLEMEKILSTSSNVYLKLNYYSFYFSNNFDSISTRDPISLGYQIINDAEDLISRNPLYDFLRISILTNMSGFFELKCDPDVRDSLLYKCLRLDSINTSPSTYYNYSLRFTRDFNYQLDSAIFYLEKAYQVKSEPLSLSLKERITKKLSQYYYELGDFKMSRNYMLQKDIFTRQIFDSQRDKSILELESKYDLQKSEEEKKILSRRLNSISAISGLGAILILMLLYIIKRTSAFQKLKKEEAKFKERLNTIIVHDLKSPLVAMEYLLESWPQKEISSDDQSKILTYIKGIHKLVDDLLVWSKLRMDKGIAIFKNENIYDYLHEIVRDYELQAKTKNVEILTEVNHSLNCSFRSDATRLIISNLISNAIKHSEATAINLKASKEQNRLIINIKDNGTGIIQSQKNNIQKILFSSSKNYRTSGLGFVIIDNLLEISNGKIEFNTGDEGTEFTLLCDIK